MEARSSPLTARMPCKRFLSQTVPRDAGGFAGARCIKVADRRAIDA